MSIAAILPSVVVKLMIEIEMHGAVAAGFEAVREELEPVKR
jgi:hypothetical protein